MGAAAERSLFASKGRATPGGVASAAEELPTAPVVAPPPAGPLQTSLPLPAAADQSPAPAAAQAESRAEAHPAGSLLTFRLRGGPGRSSLSEELKASLIPPATIAPAAAPMPTAAATVAETAAPAVTKAEPSAPEVPPAHAAPPQPAQAAPAPSAPRAERQPSARIDRPLFPRGHAGAPRAATAEPAAASIAPPHVLPSASVWRTVLPVGVAVGAIALVGWLMAQAGSGEGGVEPPVVASSAAGAAPSAAAPSVAGTADVAPAPASDSTAAIPAALQTDAPAAADTAPLPAASSQAEESGPSAADNASVATAEPPPNAIAAAPLDAPTFEVVRVEPGAPPVLAGRAAPGSQLIVLDNGVPIGSATADGNGEWALVSDAPLPAGRHELSLALKTADGTVVVEQADTETAALPDSAGADPEGLPVPGQKPAAGAAERRYVIQLASVPSAADAEREWARLQQAYPDLLGSLAGAIDAAEIGDRGTFYRVRTGPFGERGAARELCRALNGAGQECLVVREAVAD